MSLSGNTFKQITVIRGRLAAETKIEEKIIRKFMKLARSNEAKKLFEKDPCKIFTDRYIQVRNHIYRAKIYSYSKPWMPKLYGTAPRVKFEFYFEEYI